MILIVASYSPPDREGVAHLGASRKLEVIIKIISQLDSRLILINTAHNEKIPSSVLVKNSSVGGVDLLEVIPSIYFNRTIGKLINIFFSGEVLNLINRYGRPKFIWFYNAYAFEMRFAVKAWKKFQVPMILEFEDWHFSRSRGINPKPYIDYFFWRIAARFMTGTFTVNALLAEKMRDFKSHVEMLPGIVPRLLSVIANRSLPFSNPMEPIKIGFFGGLSVEKGADIVLKLATTLPSGYVLHVTGSGLLAVDFETFAKIHSDRLKYHGRVSDEILYRLIEDCDVMLNPHSSIEDMNNGVFPFKVIEAVASGRLLISTTVPSEGLGDVLIGVQFVDHDADAFRAAIVASRKYYFDNKDSISSGANVANHRFGEAALLEKVQLILNKKHNQI